MHALFNILCVMVGVCLGLSKGGEKSSGCLKKNWCHKACVGSSWLTRSCNSRSVNQLSPLHYERARLGTPCFVLDLVQEGGGGINMINAAEDKIGKLYKVFIM